MYVSRDSLKAIDWSSFAGYDTCENPPGGLTGVVVKRLGSFPTGKI